MGNCCRVPLKVDDEMPVALTVEGVQGLPLAVGETVIKEEYEDYDGAYEVTPAQYAQTLITADKHMLGNVVINPIPSNYGLVSWNGSVLTVS